MAKLGEICEILNGYAFKSENYTNEGVRIIRISNVQKGYIEDNTPAFYPCDDVNVAKYELFEGDLLISLTGNVGRVGLLDKKFLPAALNQRVACIRIKDSSTLYKLFLFNLLNNDSFERKCILSSKGVAQKNMSTEWLKNYEIPLPPLDEQRKIAAVLDKVSGLIAKRRQQLSKLDEMVKARFVEMFGDRLANNKKWNNKSLEKCAVFYNGKAHEQVVDENGQYILVTSKFVASDRKEYRRTNELLFPLYRGDICMVMSDVPNGRALAKCVLIDQDNKFTLNQRICCFRDYNMNSIFLFYVLNRHEYFLSFDDGDSQTNLRKNDILACPIILPPIELQNQFAAFVEQTGKTKTTISRSLEKLETLKKALMQEYFG